ncbi:MAG: hypothetical protein K1X64_19925 [Myxococcaceae bacterium]|nr:hypothetical protein [Myxococcaceae bacterium]
MRKQAISMLLGAGLSAGCATPQEGVVAAVDPVEERAHAAHAVVENYCQGCHLSEVSTQNTKALDVFDLADEDWAEGMPKKQLLTVVSLLSGRKIRKHLRVSATAEEVTAVRAFVADLLKRPYQQSTP